MSNQNQLLKENLGTVLKKIKEAALKSGRQAEEIHIIAVTKTIDIQRILEIVDLDIKNLGENKVQELCDKYDNIDKACKWHLIGHLQTNKVKYIIDKVAMIHSLDSLELAKEIQKRAFSIGKIMDVLIQINVAGEQTKGGLAPEQVKEFIKNISVYPNLKVKGLMTIAPFSEEPEEIRYVFKEMKKIFIDINQENIDNIHMTYLSMGMSNDYEIAIEEGANFVRIGSALFGKREYI